MDIIYKIIGVVVGVYVVRLAWLTWMCHFIIDLPEEQYVRVINFTELVLRKEGFKKLQKLLMALKGS